MRSKGEMILSGCFWVVTLSGALLLVGGEFVYAWGEMPESLYILGSVLVLAVLSLSLVLGGSLVYGQTSLNHWIVKGATAIAVFLLAVIGGGTLAGVTRQSQVRAAIAAGLEEDCRKLLDRYPDVSATGRPGLLTIRRRSQEYKDLPSSIQNFGPGVVVVQGSHHGVPVHVELIKGGFGPEWNGLRVFREPLDAPDWLRTAEQISQRTYLCIYRE
ncbi:MAG: hypothetical protein U0795_21435 [Pirellulales bacterium]